jgi:glycogen debranching enzyme
MMMARTILAALLLGAAFATSGLAGETAMPSAPRLDEMVIQVTADQPREFIFSDKGAAHLAGEAVGPDTRSYHGFYIAMHEVLDGWQLVIDSGEVLGSESAYEAEITPDRMDRRHRTRSGEIITETVELWDRENGFKVSYDGVPGGRFAVKPRLDMRFLWKVGKPGYEVRWEGDTMLACRTDALNKAPDPAHPAWVAVAVAGSESFEPDGRHTDVVYPKGKARKAMDRLSPYHPGSIVGQIPPRIPSGTVDMFVAADVTAEAALARVQRHRQQEFDLRAARRERLQKLIDDSAITTGVPRDDLALAWARVSLDNLVMNQRGWGIYAGFYWFTTYWGRDTFITLPGACITSGQFDMAETLLRGFSEYQDTDPASERQGRVPNFVTVDQVQYASIDGTWWFVRALDELWRQSGNDDFVRELAPVVYRAVQGALDHAVDEQGFLTHGDGETWMDGGGEANPYSPRGNRAVDVQALWHRGLLTAARIAERFPDVPGARGDYAQMAAKLEESFHKRFWHGDQLVDHLDVNGDQDRQIRPNTLLAVLASPTLFNAKQRQAITELAGKELVMPWGVRSLNADDPFYHPRHLNLGEYYYDEAYHNGDIWLWLSGSYVSALNNPAEGFGQTRMLLTEVLDEGAVGTIQEIRDGDPAESNDEFGGATSQAWSLAELLRNVVQDYAGLQVDLTSQPPVVTVRPSLPAEWPELNCRTRIGQHGCVIKVAGGKAPQLVFDGPGPEGWQWRWVGKDGKMVPGKVSNKQVVWESR